MIEHNIILLQEESKVLAKFARAFFVGRALNGRATIHAESA